MKWTAFIALLWLLLGAAALSDVDSSSEIEPESDTVTDVESEDESVSDLDEDDGETEEDADEEEGGRGTCDVKLFQGGLDYSKITMLDGKPATSQDQTPCLISYKHLSKVIRHSTWLAKRKNLWLAGADISVNNQPRLDTVAPGVYINNVAAQYVISSYAFDYSSSKRQEQCVWDAVFTLLPRKQSRTAEGYTADEYKRQEELCYCPEFVDCISRGFGSKCNWNNWWNIFTTPPNPSFCFEKVCSFMMLPNGKTLSMDGDSNCATTVLSGTKKKNWFVDVRSFGFHPKLIREQWKGKLRNLPKLEAPDTYNGVGSDLVREENSNPNKWRCIYSQWTVFEHRTGYHLCKRTMEKDYGQGPDFNPYEVEGKFRDTDSNKLDRKALRRRTRRPNWVKRNSRRR